GIFYGKGEVCAGGSRLLVAREIKDEFMTKLAARTKKMVAGDPLDPKTRYGALASKKQLETVARYVDVAKKEGASLVAGGDRIDIGTGKGYFFAPTVFDSVTPDMTIAREEIFGPSWRRSSSRIWTKRSPERTGHNTDSPRRSGRGTSRRRTTSPGACRRAPSGSTPITSMTRRRRSAATRPADSAAR
ncbi:MAG TPA: aldehyde dehydrogenase family protein, partial [Vicinamibacterales bacterium]|nr:aldehyde dehydrogenase family protein [Vicinamibacterales bacterium]